MLILYFFQYNNVTCLGGGMVDTEDSKSSAFGCKGSSPFSGTIF